MYLVSSPATLQIHRAQLHSSSSFADAILDSILDSEPQRLEPGRLPDSPGDRVIGLAVQHQSDCVDQGLALPQGSPLTDHPT